VGFLSLRVGAKQHGDSDYIRKTNIILRREFRSRSWQGRPTDHFIPRKRGDRSSRQRRRRRVDGSNTLVASSNQITCQDKEQKEQEEHKEQGWMGSIE
jgi:hypothetical protein